MKTEHEETAAEESVHVTFLSNAAVLLRYRGTSLLLDGVYSPEGHPFSNLPEGSWERLIAGQPPFENVDYLLFTHRHPDHFSPELVRQLLKRRSFRGVCFPDDPSDSLRALKEELREAGIPYAAVSGRTACRITPQITARAIPTAHLDRKFRDVRHLCYCISFDGKHVLFTADVDYTAETLQAVSGMHLRAAFVNPLFFHVLEDKRFFKGSLSAEQIAVYHVPFAQDDAMGMGAMLDRDLDGQEGRSVIALREPYQQLLL